MRSEKMRMVAAPLFTSPWDTRRHPVEQSRARIADVRFAGSNQPKMLEHLQDRFRVFNARDDLQWITPLKTEISHYGEVVCLTREAATDATSIGRRCLQWYGSLASWSHRLSLSCVNRWFLQSEPFSRSRPIAALWVVPGFRFGDGGVYQLFNRV